MLLRPSCLALQHHRNLPGAVGTWLSKVNAKMTVPQDERAPERALIIMFPSGWSADSHFLVLQRLSLSSMLQALPHPPSADTTRVMRLVVLHISFRFLAIAWLPIATDQ